MPQVAVWSTTLTVSVGGGVFSGCSDQNQSLTDCSTALTDNTFTYSARNYRVTEIVKIAGTDVLAVDFATEQAGLSLKQTSLILNIGSASAVLADTGQTTSNNGRTLNLHPDFFNAVTFTDGQQVSVSLTEPVKTLTLSASGALREGEGPVTVTATLNGPAVGDVGVTVNLDGTATWDSDYRTPVGGFGNAPSCQAAGLVTIRAGQTSASFRIEVVNDTHEDSGETVEIYASVNGARGVNGAGVSDDLTLTITNHEDGTDPPVVEPEDELTGLALSAGSGAVALSPAFATDVLRYRASVPAGAGEVSLAASWSGKPHVFAESRTSGYMTLTPSKRLWTPGTTVALKLAAGGGTTVRSVLVFDADPDSDTYGWDTEYVIEAVAPDQEQTAASPLTASFEQVPAEHRGKGSFRFLVRLSEAVDSFSKSSVQVTRGGVRSVERVEDGLWRVRVKPSSWRDVGVTLAGGRDCGAAGAVCTPDGRGLENTVTATAADVGYGMAGPGGRGTGTPYAGLVSSAMGYRALRYGCRWTVDRGFDAGVEGARQDGLGGMLDHLGHGAADLGRRGDASHSVPVRGGVTF